MIGVVGAVTILFKASGPVLLGGRELPPRVASVVEVLAPAMLAALVVTQTFGGDRELVLDERLAGVVGRRRRGLAARAAHRRHGRRRRGRRTDPTVLGSPAMRVEEMVERVWPGREATIEVLGGGITNRNFKVTLDDGAYVLRIGGKDTELLGIDRRVEHEASLAAAAVGVGPEVVAFIEPEGYLVTRFIGGERGRAGGDSGARGAPSGRAVPPRRPRGPPIPARFDSFRVVEAYARDGCDARRSRFRRAYERARETAALVERARGPRARASVPQRPPDRELHRRRQPDPDRRLGVRGHGRRLLRPRELRGQQRARPTDETASCCAAYFGDVRPEHERALPLMRFMSDFREAMWGVVQQALSDLDFDFRGYADEHFERLERTASERRFRKALG